MHVPRRSSPRRSRREVGLGAIRSSYPARPSRPRIHRVIALARETDQLLHLGLTGRWASASWPASAMGVFFRRHWRHDPRPHAAASDRREEYMPRAGRSAFALHRASRLPRLRTHDELHAPGAGRADSGAFATRCRRFPTRAETMTLADGVHRERPGDRRPPTSAPACREPAKPNCPIFIDGQHVKMLRGRRAAGSVEFTPC